MRRSSKFLLTTAAITVGLAGCAVSAQSGFLAEPMGARVGALRDKPTARTKVWTPKSPIECPIAGSAQFVDDYGITSHNGKPHTHQGTDVFARRGARVQAVASGRITVAGNDGGAGGLRIWLTSTAGDQYYYAHLANLSVRAGTRVTAGQTLGAVGNTGDAEGGPPHVHFEVHPGGGEAVNPYPALTAAC